MVPLFIFFSGNHFLSLFRIKMSSSRTFFQCKRFKSHFIRNSPHASSLNVNFSGTGLPQSPLWWARLMPSWRWWSCWWSTRWRWWAWWWLTWCWWSWSCWWWGGWEWMPGRNLSGGESHFSIFFVAHFSPTKLDFCHRPPLSNVKGKITEACFL